jgi:hypothetical protein
MLLCFACNSISVFVLLASALFLTANKDKECYVCGLLLLKWCMYYPGKKGRACTGSSQKKFGIC